MSWDYTAYLRTCLAVGWGYGRGCTKVLPLVIDLEMGLPMGEGTYLSKVRTGLIWLRFRVTRVYFKMFQSKYTFDSGCAFPGAP